MILFNKWFEKFGLRLNIENQILDSTMQATSMGSSFLSHAIKNEILKINFLAHRINQLLAEGKQVEALSYVKSLSQINDNLNLMIDRIFDTTTDLVLNLQEVRLEEMISNVLPLIEEQCVMKNIKLIVNLRNDIILKGDVIHMQEMLYNILQNGIDAMNGQQGTLEINISKTAFRLIIEIKDSGKGISKDKWTKIFEPFYSTKRRSDRYGLGLCYCFSVIKKHKGTIRVTESSPEQGTTLAVTFPRNMFRTLS